MNTLGIDIGVATGLGERLGDKWSSATVAPGLKNKSDELLQHLYVTIFKMVRKNAYDAVCIEGLSFGQSNAIDQARTEAVIRLACINAGMRSDQIWYVSPSSLKKWAYGTRDKNLSVDEAMILSSRKEWGDALAANSHQSVALHLANIIHHLLSGTAPDLAYRREVLKSTVEANEKIRKAQAPTVRTTRKKLAS